MTPADHASELRTEGYTVFTELYSPDEVISLRDAIESAGQQACAGRYYAGSYEELSPGAALTSSGLALNRLLHTHPALAPLYFRPRFIDTMRVALGPSPRLEIGGAMISDRERPFFTWHTHIDGADEGNRVSAEHWPAQTRIARILNLLYLRDVDEGMGALLILPRRMSDPAAPPSGLEETAWPGQVRLHPRAGTLVCLEQHTWHAAERRQVPGKRTVLGSAFASLDAGPADWTDPELHDAVVFPEPVFSEAVFPKTSPDKETARLIR